MKKESTVTLISGFIFLAVILWALFKFIGFFAAASDNVKAASITALVSVSIFMIGRYAEQKREIRQRVNLEKIEVYRRFFDIYFGIFSPKNRNEEGGIINIDITDDLFEFQKDLVVWGSDRVINDWLLFKQELINFSEIEPEEKIQSLAEVFKRAGALFATMRKDIGYSFTQFSGKQLVIMQLNEDQERKEILSILSR